MRKHDKIIAFLDNPKAKVVDDDEGDDDDEEKPKARVFKASQQAPSSELRPAHAPLFHAVAAAV